MPTPLKKSFNILNTSPNYPSCNKYYSLFISSDLFSSVRLFYTLNKKNLSVRISSEILRDSYTINYEQTIYSHHCSVFYCFCYAHLLKASNEAIETLLNVALAQIKRILGVFFFVRGLLQSEPMTEVGGVITNKVSAPLSAYEKHKSTGLLSFQKQ